jgi:hypothetical protein
MEETHHLREATTSSDNQQSDVIVHPLENGNWKVFGRRVPKSELVFFSQVIILYAVVCMCLFNLTTGRGDSNLWSALLSGSLGYLLPNPKIK